MVGLGGLSCLMLAVVIGDEGRDKKVEDAITGGGGRVETVLDRLRVDVLSGSPGTPGTPEV